MCPSQASALTWADVDLERPTISISKSRYMGSEEAAPKTPASARVIHFSEPVADVLQILLSRALGLAHLFVNKVVEPMNASRLLKKAG